MVQSLKLLAFIEFLQFAAIGIFWLCLRNDARRLVRPIDLALIAILPLAGLFLGNKFLFYLVLCTIPFFYMNSSTALASRYLLFLPIFPELSDNIIIGGKFLGDFSAIDFFNLAFFIAMLLTMKLRVRRLTSIDIAAWIFFAACLIMVGRGVPLNGYVRLIATTLLSVIAPFYVISRLIRTRHDASDAALFLALGGFINAVVAVFEARRGWPLYQAYYNALHVDMVGLSATLAIRAGFMRAQGALANPASLGLLLALALLAVLTLRSRFKPAGRYLVMALLSVGIAASQSRGAWIAALFGMCLYFLYNRRTMMLAAFGTIGSIALVIMAAAPSGSHLAQFLGRSGSGRQTAEYRSNLLSRGIQEVLAHPLVGQTRDQLEVTMNDLRQGEHIIDFVNTHLTIALTGGLFMFAAWMAAWSAPMLAGWRVRGWSAARREPGGIALPFAMIGACFACLTLTSTIDRMLPLTMLSIGLMSACVSLVKTTDGAVRRQAATRRHPALAPPMRSA